LKKTIAMLAAICVSAVSAFAEGSATIGGMIGFRADVINNTPYLEDNDREGAHRFGRDWEHQGRLNITAHNGAGTVGGTLRMWLNHGGGRGYDEIRNYSPPLSQFHGFIWWQPMPQLRLTIGRDPWGMHGVGDLVGWSFNANNAESWFLGWGDASAGHYGTTNLEGRGRGQRNAGAFSRNTGFYPGFGDTGITALIRPSELPQLSVMLALPWIIEGDNDALHSASRSGHWLEPFMRAHVSVRYGIPGVGTASLSWIGGPGDAGWNPDGTQRPLNDIVGDGWLNRAGSVRRESSTFFASFVVTALQAQGMQFNVGVAYTIPYTQVAWTSAYDVVTHFPIEAGVGFLYTQGNLRVPVRAAATFGGRHAGYTVPWRVGLNINPRYNLGIFNVHLAAGFSIIGPGGAGPQVITYSSDPTFGWHVTPHISREIAGPVRMFVGVHIEDGGYDGAANSGLSWRIPIGIHLEW